MANYYSDHPEFDFYLNHPEMRRVVDLREKGYEYSVCGCYLSDAKNYYYEFLEDDWEQMEDNCIKKIIGYAFAKDNNLPLDRIVSSVKELLKNGTNGIRDVITEGFEEVAI